MDTRRFKLEFVDRPDVEPEWFDTREELDSTITFLKECPIVDGPIWLRITEYGVTKIEES